MRAKRITDCIAPRAALIAMLLMPVGACRQGSTSSQPVLAPPPLDQFDEPLASASWQEPQSWPQFAHDPLHTGRSDVDFPSARLEEAWRFRPSEHVYQYLEGMSVWSSPVAGTVDGRPLVIAGYFDRNVYAVDVRTGEKVWEYQPGGYVFAAPVLARVEGRPLVILAAMNRSIYGLDAATGEQKWVRETAGWTFTRALSQMSSPTVVHQDGQPVVLVGVWNADRSAANPATGELMALRAADGEIIWRRRLASVPVTSPAVARMGTMPAVFVAAHHGTVYAVRMADGVVLWESTLNEVTRSSPSLAPAGGAAHLLIGTRQQSLFALDPTSGAREWYRQTGYWIDSTPAWMPAGDTTITVAGSYDRGIYGWRISDGQQLWQTMTGNYAYSSPALATVDGRPVAFHMSWDQKLYLLDAANAQILWTTASGPLVWSHAYQGDSLWASPAVIRLDGRAMVLFPGLDGVLYAYVSVSAKSASPSTDPAP
jgi:outer membrane protein assembly factor BamB